MHIDKTIVCIYGENFVRNIPIVRIFLFNFSMCYVLIRKCVVSNVTLFQSSEMTHDFFF